jgi:heme/copper-type cytochrome/quinol oxidase subunit 4
MSTLIASTDHTHPNSQPVFRRIRLWVLGYVVISVVTLAAIVVLRHNSAAVNPAVWTRGIIVVASACVTLACAIRAARGSRGAYRRLRLISALMVVAIVVIIALPGSFPTWMKVDQGACGLVLLRVAMLANGVRARSPFACK